MGIQHVYYNTLTTTRAAFSLTATMLAAGVATGYHLPGDLDPSDPQGRTTNEGWRYRRSNACAARLVQRFGSALLNIHFHILFLDGVYVYRDRLGELSIRKRSGG